MSEFDRQLDRASAIVDQIGDDTDLMYMVLHVISRKHRMIGALWAPGEMDVEVGEGNSVGCVDDLEDQDLRARITEAIGDDERWARVHDALMQTVSNGFDFWPIVVLDDDGDFTINW